VPTLLCVDDQEENLNIRKIFLQAQGYDVLMTTSALEGLRLLAQQPVDLLILDYRMPEMDGEEFARHARKIKPKVPILLLSGFSLELPKSLRALVDAVVLKGEPASVLVEQVKALAGDPSAPAPPRPDNLLQASLLHADRARQRVAEVRKHVQQVREAREATKSDDRRKQG
jgi:CheY-like chemotaxis protein